MTETPKAEREAPDPLDTHLGARLKQRRNLVGMSQEQLGKASGLTFQQIQKYERGSNRIASSRLYQFAQILNVPVAYFYDAMPAMLRPDVANPGFGESGQAALEGVPGAATVIEEDVMTKRETTDLIRAYYSITDAKQRRKIYELIKAMADDDASVKRS